MYLMRLTIFSLFFLVGCGGVTINVISPDHMSRIWAPAEITDCNGVTTKILHNGWYMSDRTVRKVQKAKVK